MAQKMGQKLGGRKVLLYSLPEQESRAEESATSCSILSFIPNMNALYNPALYHGHGKTQNFFEGWYYKFVSADEQNVWAIIPGVFLGQGSRDSHVFIQTLNGRTGQSHYHRFPLEAFRASRDEFDVQIEHNHFRADCFSLHLERPEQTLTGELQFHNPIPWPVTIFSPGIMGWYSFMPFMECYHGVVSLDHPVSGVLNIDGQHVDFGDGRGYIEKDWGQAFPRAWVWMQTNHFSVAGTCLSASVARIPWLGAAFRGFIVGLWHGGHLHRFATYNNSQILQLQITDSHITWAMHNATHRLELVAQRAEGGLLHAPMRTAMQARVLESLTASVHVRLIERRSEKVLFEDVGRHAGLEVGGEVVLIL